MRAGGAAGGGDASGGDASGGDANGGDASGGDASGGDASRGRYNPPRSPVRETVSWNKRAGPGCRGSRAPPDPEPWDPEPSNPASSIPASWSSLVDLGRRGPDEDRDLRQCGTDRRTLAV
jgi:hypothetical protein